MVVMRSGFLLVLVATVCHWLKLRNSACFKSFFMLDDLLTCRFLVILGGRGEVADRNIFGVRSFVRLPLVSR